MEIMKYCSQCGKEIFEDAVICVNCGCAVNSENKTLNFSTNSFDMLNTLSSRLNINGIIWLVIGILQIFGGIFINWFLLIVGTLNIISSIQDINYSKTMLEKPEGIVNKFEPLTGPVVILIYNLLIGGIVGIIGSIYYFIAVRNFVLENKEYFLKFDN